MNTSIFKRTETKWNGGDTLAGQFLSKQIVKIGKCVNEDDDEWIVYDADGKAHRVEGFDLSPHPDSALTNEEFLLLMLNWSKTSLIHPFIFQAIEQYARATLKAADAELENPLINPDAWRDTAREALGWFAARQAVEEERRNKND